MENREFISAADLPVAEGDEVSVLCLENGEMKQKPGASLSGGSTKWDAVIDIVGGTGVNVADSLTLTSGSYDAVKAKIEAGELPNVLIRWAMVYGTNYNVVGRADTVADVPEYSHIYITLGDSYAAPQRMKLNADGTVESA